MKKEIFFIFSSNFIYAFKRYRDFNNLQDCFKQYLDDCTIPVNGKVALKF